MQLKCTSQIKLKYDELFIKVQEIRLIHLKFFLLKVGLLLVKAIWTNCRPSPLNGPSPFQGRGWEAEMYALLSISSISSAALKNFEGFFPLSCSRIFLYSLFLWKKKRARRPVFSWEVTVKMVIFSRDSFALYYSKLLCNALPKTCLALWDILVNFPPKSGGLKKAEIWRPPMRCLMLSCPLIELCDDVP